MRQYWSAAAREDSRRLIRIPVNSLVTSSSGSIKFLSHLTNGGVLISNGFPKRYDEK